MQLKIQRSQRQGGLVSKTTIFCLDARVAFTPDETANIRRYKLQDQLIYSSDGAKAAAAGSAAAVQNARGQGLYIDSMDGLLSSAASKMGSGLKAAALGALSRMKLNITIASLESGQHIECKSLDELLGAEEAIMDACRSLRGYLDAAATFDGREMLIDFTSEDPTVVASSPAPQLVAPASASPQVVPLQVPRRGASPALAGASVLNADAMPTEHSFPSNTIEGSLERAFAAVSGDQWAALMIVGTAAVVLLVFVVNAL